MIRKTDKGGSQFSEDSQREKRLSLPKPTEMADERCTITQQMDWRNAQADLAGQ